MKTANAIGLVGFLLLATGLVAWGFFHAGTPATQAAIKRDASRLGHMYRVAHAVHRNARPPAGRPGQPITEGLLLKAQGEVQFSTDPRIAESLRLRRVDDTHYEICVTFEHSSERWRQASRAFSDIPISHPGGRFCKVFSVDERLQYFEIYYDD